MKNILSLILLFTFCVGLQAGTKAPKHGNLQMGDYGYLYCHMSDHGQWTAFALSRDGLNYHDLLGGDSIFSAVEMAGIEGGTRDAYICRKIDGTGYLMVTTDMNNSMTKRLNKGGEWENFGIDLLVSDDLIHWTSTTIDFRKGLAAFCDGNDTSHPAYKDFSTISRVWAPQIIWDGDYRWADGTKGGYMIYYSLLNRPEEGYDRMYYSHADRTFTRLTQPRVLFDWGYATIDADINWLETDQKYHLMIKKEGGKPGLFTSASPKLTGPWPEPIDDDYISFEGNKKCEGVSAFQIAGEEGWRIGYIEYSSKPRNYRICRADKNMRNFSDPQNIQGVNGPQHGSFLRLTKEEYERLQSWSDLVMAQRMATAAYYGNWRGKRCAFLGDSMTDPSNRAANYHYYDLLRDSLGIEPRVYARSGHQWHQILEKAKLMQQTDSTTIDAIFIWAGTNDYNHGVPIGKFFTERDTVCDRNGKMVPARHREWCMNDTTFCGRINMCLSWFKHNYPTKQIIVMTPIHRAYANFTDPEYKRINVQPDEDFTNIQGLYIEQYMDVLRQACQYWAVPCIDLYQDSGLYPMEPEHGVYFAEPEPKEGTPRYDRLHPNNAGHIRLGKTIMAHLRALPCL